MGVKRKRAERTARVAVRACLARALGRSTLEMSAGQEATLHDYMQRFSCLSTWYLRQDFTCSTKEELDAIIPQFLDELFLNGREAGEGAKLIAVD